MNYQEKISIIVPVYKVEKYIRRCVDSLLAQNYKNIEIVLVDDGSPDNCPLICDDYDKKNENVITYHKENGGLSSARNYGVKMAKADLIVFVDSDDYVEPTYVSDLYSLMIKYNSDLAITRIIREDENGNKKKGRSKIVDRRLSAEEAFIETYTGSNVGWEAYGKIYRKNLLLKNPFPDGYYEDFANLYRIIGMANSVSVGNYENNYHYITRKGSILTSRFSNKHLRVFDICAELEAYIFNNFIQYEFLTFLLYERAFIQIYKLNNLNTSEQKRLYNRYRKKFIKGMPKILFSKQVAFYSKYYAFALYMGFFPFRIAEGLVSLRDKRLVR